MAEHLCVGNHALLHPAVDETPDHSVMYEHESLTSHKRIDCVVDRASWRIASVHEGEDPKYLLRMRRVHALDDPHDHDLHDAPIGGGQPVEVHATRVGGFGGNLKKLDLVKSLFIFFASSATPMMHPDLARPTEDAIDDDLRSIVGDNEGFWQELETHEVSPLSPSQWFTLEDVDTLLEDSYATNEMAKKMEKNHKRRSSDVERLHKYSWQRIPREGDLGKRKRFDYVNKDGERESSLRKALERCRASEAQDSSTTAVA